MKKILLCCAAGMSTSLLVNKMKAVADERGLEIEIWAEPLEKVRNEIKKRIMKKETVIKTSRVGIASSRRLRMNFNIDISCPVLLPKGRGFNTKARRLAGLLVMRLVALLSEQ